MYKPSKIGLAASATSVLLLGAACRSTSVTSEPAAPPPAPVSAAVPQSGDSLPAGTVLRAQLNQQISTETSRAGDRFTARVMDNVVAANGDVVVPAGSTVSGTVTEIKPSSHIGEQAAVGLRFDTLSLAGRAVPIDAELVETDVEESRKGGDIAKGAGAGALGGAALGAILGGGSGALKGGLIGAGGGSLVSLGAGDVQAKLPAGSLMTLRLNSTVGLR